MCFYLSTHCAQHLLNSTQTGSLLNYSYKGLIYLISLENIQENNPAVSQLYVDHRCIIINTDIYFI